MKTIIALYDLHYPLYEPACLSIALQLAKDYPPDIFILGGDNLNCGSVSSHSPPAKERLSNPMDEEFEGFDIKILQPIEALKCKEKVLFIGNHEMWLYDYIAAHPELGNDLDFVKRLSLKERGWKIIPYKQYHHVGKLCFHHGDWRTSRKGMSYGAKHHAHRALEMSGKSVRYGHLHTEQSHTVVRQAKQLSPMTAKCIPCACKFDQPYLEGGYTAWLQGIYLGWVLDDGTFSDYSLIVTKGRTVFAGKTYIAK